jgi:hypothetical protein
MGLDYMKNLTLIINEYKSNPQKEKTLDLLVTFNLIRFALPLLSKKYRTQFGELAESLTGLKINLFKDCIIKIY